MGVGAKSGTARTRRHTSNPLWHPHVHENSLGSLLFGHFNAGGPVDRRNCLETVRFQGIPEQTQEEAIVVNAEDLRPVERGLLGLDGPGPVRAAAGDTANLPDSFFPVLLSLLA